MEHLEALVRSNLGELVGQEDIAKLVARWSGRDQSMRDQLQEPKTRTRLAAVIRELLDEGVPVTAGAEIFEVLRTASALDQLPALVRAARMRLKHDLPGNQSSMHRALLPEEWEQELRFGLKTEDRTAYSEVSPEVAHAILLQVRRWLNGLSLPAAIIVRNSHFRFVLRRLIRAEFPDIPVLAEEEALSVEQPARLAAAESTRQNR
jgi:flagellar biosynthesis component FlhA